MSHILGTLHRWRSDCTRLRSRVVKCMPPVKLAKMSSGLDIDPHRAQDSQLRQYGCTSASDCQIWAQWQQVLPTHCSFSPAHPLVLTNLVHFKCVPSKRGEQTKAWKLSVVLQAQHRAWQWMECWCPECCWRLLSNRSNSVLVDTFLIFLQSSLTTVSQ